MIDLMDQWVNSVIKVNLSGIPYSDLSDALVEILAPFPNMTGTIYSGSEGPVLTAREPLTVGVEDAADTKMEAAADSARQIGRSCKVKWEVIREDGSLVDQSDFIDVPA